jgi:hypothetical protein
MAKITPGRTSVYGGGVSARRMALVIVALVAALSAALLVTSGVGPGTAEAQTAQATGTARHGERTSTARSRFPRA